MKEPLMTQSNSEDYKKNELFTEENDDAEALLTSGNMAGAARKLVEIVELDPCNYRAYNTIGLIAWIRKAWQDALGMFLKSVNLKPDYTDALLNLFDAALKLHCVWEIEPFFKRAGLLRPFDQEIKTIHQCIISEGDGIYKSERALRIGTYNPRLDAAEALIAEGNFDDATKQFIKIHDAEGPSDRGFCGLGVISFHQQRYADAFSLFAESVKLNPTSCDNFLNMLDAAKACGRQNDAKALFQSYLNKFPFLKELETKFETDNSIG
jgi:tetratricopeptide (TPR) repeat protein